MRAWLPILACLGCGRLGFEERAGTAGDAVVDLPCGPTTALLGHWAFDADEIAGTKVLDRSGQGHHGMLIGTPPPSVGPGRDGEALDFTGTTTAYVELADLPVGASAFTTAAMWFFHPAQDVDEVLIYLPPGPGTAPPRYDLWLNTDRIGSPALCINSGVGDCWGVEDPTLLGRWVHVVAVFADGPTTGGSLFVDGKPVVMSCVFGTCDQTRVVQNPVTLAASDDTYAWHGLLDDVRLFGRALEAGEARTLFDCAP